MNFFDWLPVRDGFKEGDYFVSFSGVSVPLFRKRLGVLYVHDRDGNDILWACYWDVNPKLRGEEIVRSLSSEYQNV